MRIPLIAVPLLASASLAACSNAWRPPEIQYDETPRQAVLQPDPPKPVQIVELPKCGAIDRDDAERLLIAGFGGNWERWPIGARPWPADCRCHHVMPSW